MIVDMNQDKYAFVEKAWVGRQHDIKTRILMSSSSLLDEAITAVVIHNTKKFPKLTPENKVLSLLHLLSIKSSFVSYLAVSRGYFPVKEPRFARYILITRTDDL